MGLPRPKNGQGLSRVFASFLKEDAGDGIKVGMFCSSTLSVRTLFIKEAKIM